MPFRAEGILGDAEQCKVEYLFVALRLYDNIRTSQYPECFPHAFKALMVTGKSVGVQIEVLFVGNFYRQ